MKKLLLLISSIAILVGGFYLYKHLNKAPENNTDKKETSQSIAIKNTNGKVVSEATKSKPAQDVKQTNYSPAIWKIEHNGKTSYLFGSIHVGDKSMYPLPQKIMDAFAAADVLAVEANINNINRMEMAQMVQQLALDLENPLPTVLSPKTKEKYDEYCETKAAVCNMVKVFEPWMAAMTIEVMEIVQAGYREDLGIDKFFLKGADNKKIVELESIEGQLKMLDQMPKELQDYMLMGAVSKDADDFEQLMGAWKIGRTEDVLAKAEQESKALGIPEEIRSQFNDIFLYQRNQVMADGIAEQIRQGKAVFAVVGAAHYAGKNSVNQYLEEKGFKVIRL